MYSWRTGERTPWGEVARTGLFITLRSLAWGAAAVALAWALMTALAPRGALPPSALLSLFPSLVPLMILLAVVATSPSVAVRLTDRGVFVNRTRGVRWADARGHWSTDDRPGELFLLERRGRVTRVPLPPEPLRSDVLAFVEPRAPRLSEAEVAPHAKPVDLHWSHALGITLVAGLNGLAAAWVGVAVGAAGGAAGLALGALVLACTPAGAFCTAGFAARYPQHRFLRVHVFVLVTMLAAGYGGIVLGALVARGQFGA